MFCHLWFYEIRDAYSMVPANCIQTLATPARTLEENIAVNIEHFHKYPKRIETKIKISWLRKKFPLRN